MRILVTGAYGQLGSEIARLKHEYPSWVFLFTDIDSLDLTNETAVREFFAKNPIDFVVNCAAYTSVDKAESEAVMAELVNTTAPKILANQAKSCGAKLIHISTDYVFAGDGCTPYLEDDPVDPQGIYGQTKLQGERNVFAENPDSVVIRTSWLYSEFGHNFVKTMLRLGSEKEEISVVFDQVGTPTYAADLAKTILDIIKQTQKHNTKFVPGVYHFSNEGVASWFDFATAIFELQNIKCRIKPVLSNQFPTPAKRPAYSVLNKSKIKDTFQLNIPYWRDSLKICLKQIEKI
jgi:dTDP-4-dehydrorhamnose reductase